MVPLVVFVIALLAALTINGLAVIQLFSGRSQLWPPLSTTGWQHRLLRWLFRVMFLGLIFLSVSDFGELASSSWRHYFAVPIWVLGFGAAFYLTNRLGWRNAFGATDGLQVDGAYQWSRNPIYVVSIIGMIGWGLSVASSYAWTLLFLWALFYLIAPFVEEAWLEKKYGQEYIAYKAGTPRFLGIRRKTKVH